MNYLLIGFGIVGANLVDHLDGMITVIEKQDFDIQHIKIKKIIHTKVDHTNFERLLFQNTQIGDLIIDTAVELNTAEMCLWAHKNGRHYLNTVCDKWLSETLALTQNYQNINHLLDKYVYLPLAITNMEGCTCLMGHGANTGMVNHFFKKAIADKADALQQSCDAVIQQIKEVYILEKDTLNFKKGFTPKADTFYNTWNIQEFLLESSALPDYPAKGRIHKAERPEIRDVFLDHLCIHGRVVSHEETFTIDHFLQKKGCTAEKIQFLYECSPIGEVSRIQFPFGSTYKTVTATSALDTELGFDLVGALLVLQDGSNWFCGYQLFQNTILDPHQTNATAWFVSAGVLAGIDFIKHYPNKGINFPENVEFVYNQKIIDYFFNYTPKTGFISRPIHHLFISEAYPTYAVGNLKAPQLNTKSLVKQLQFD